MSGHNKARWPQRRWWQKNYSCLFTQVVAITFFQKEYHPLNICTCTAACWSLRKQLPIEKTQSNEKCLLLLMTVSFVGMQQGKLKHPAAQAAHRRAASLARQHHRPYRSTIPQTSGYRASNKPWGQSNASFSEKTVTVVMLIDSMHYNPYKRSIGREGSTPLTVIPVVTN